MVEISSSKDDFDSDLARLGRIRSGGGLTADCAFLLSFIDKLWREYSHTLAKLDQRNAVETKAPYGIPEVLDYLNERAAWLKREWQNGGDFSYLHLKQEECEYIASCIKDMSERLNAVKAAEALAQPFTQRDAEAMANVAISLDRDAYKAKLVNVAAWIENGCDPKQAAQELRLMAGAAEKATQQRKFTGSGHLEETGYIDPPEKDIDPPIKGDPEVGRLICEAAGIDLDGIRPSEKTNDPLGDASEDDLRFLRNLPMTYAFTSADGERLERILAGRQ